MNLTEEECLGLHGFFCVLQINHLPREFNTREALVYILKHFDKRRKSTLMKRNPMFLSYVEELLGDYFFYCNSCGIFQIDEDLKSSILCSFRDCDKICCLTCHGRKYPRQRKFIREKNFSMVNDFYCNVHKE